MICINGIFFFEGEGGGGVTKLLMANLGTYFGGWFCGDAGRGRIYRMW